MDIYLSSYETRIIGCLIEKEITTPEQYPLSLNALVNACNQKSNREPVLGLDESTVLQTVDELIKKHLVSDRTGFGSRVTKYRHRFCNTEFDPLKFSAQELGIVCVLLLRGPQTPGELRTRTNRLCKFSDVREVEDTLTGLIEREDGPFVARLPRETGRRESRYAHLFSGDVESEQIHENSTNPQQMSTPDQARLEQLENLVGELRQDLDQLKRKLDQLATSNRLNNKST